MRISKLAFCFALVFAAGTCFAQTIKTFDVPNSSSTVAVAINLEGEITGYYFVPYSNGSVQNPQSFLRNLDGTITTFGLQFPYGTQANGINLFGEIVGTASCCGVDNGFLRKADGTILTFFGSGETSTPSAALAEPAPTLNCPYVDGTAAIAINAVGQVTGSFGQGCLLGFLRQPDGTSILFQAGQGLIIDQLTVPQAINLVGQIAGYYYDQNGYGGFLRQTDGTIVTFKVPGSSQTFAQGMNLFGQIVGYYDGHGFLRQPNGTFITIDPSGSVGTQPAAINFAGQITGFFATADGIYHGFLWMANGMIETFDAPNAVGTFPKDINDLGQIVGYYSGCKLRVARIRS